MKPTIPVPAPIRDRWIKTYSGVHFHPLAPKAKDILIEDIAHALSNQCRFAGHTSRFYSVAEHSVNVMRWTMRLAGSKANRRLLLAALLHDASEAYLVDVPSPIKSAFTGYAEAEDRLSRMIANKFGAAYPWPELVPKADWQMLGAEADELVGGTEDWGIPVVKPALMPIGGMAPDVARSVFLTAFYNLQKF